MEEQKNTHGGARKGSGRKKKEGFRKVTFNISDQVINYLTYYSECTGIEKSRLVNDLLLSELFSNSKDFVYCPKCNAPVAYIPAINIIGDCEFECKCGNTFDVNFN